MAHAIDRSLAIPRTMPFLPANRPIAINLLKQTYVLILFDSPRPASGEMIRDTSYGVTAKISCLVVPGQGAIQNRIKSAFEWRDCTDGMIGVDFAGEKPVARTQLSESGSWLSSILKSFCVSHASSEAKLPRAFDVFLREPGFRLDRRVSCQKIKVVVMEI